MASLRGIGLFTLPWARSQQPEANRLGIEQILYPHFPIGVEVLLPRFLDLDFRKSFFDLFLQDRCSRKAIERSDKEVLLVRILFIKTQQIIKVDARPDRYIT